MPFVAVDASKLTFDKPGTPSGFAPVDISQIPMDSPSLGQRLNNDLDKRTGMIADLGKSLLTDPARGIAPTALAAIGKGIYGMTSDAVADVAKSAYNALPDLPDSTKRGARYVGESLGDTDTAAYLVDKAKDAAGAVGSAYDWVRNANPIVADLGDAAADTTMMAPVSRPIEAVKAPITRNMVRTAANNAYKHVEQSGTTFTPQGVNKVLDIVESAKQTPSFNGTVLTGEQKSVNNALDEFLPARGQAGSIADVQTLDSNLGDKAAMAYVAGDANKARILSDVQDKIRQSIQPDKLAAGDISGSAEGIDALTQHAIPLWSTQAKMADIQKIIDRANMMDNPSTGIKTGFRNYALNSGKMAQLPENVQSQIMKAAKTGKTDDLLGVLGSRLNAIGGGIVGGVPGEMVAHATSSLFRNARTGLKNAQANAVLDSMVNGVRPSVAKYLDGVPKMAAPAAEAASSIAPKLLTYQPPEKVLAADSAGNIAPQTADQQASGIMARRSAIATGLTPDVVATQIKNMTTALTPNFVQSDLGRALLANPQLLMATIRKLPLEQGKALVNIVR